MSKVQLTVPTRKALLAILIVNAEEVTNPVLKERCGLEIDVPVRTQLLKHKLITAERRGNPYYYTLTGEGREQALRELAAEAPERGTNLKLLYAIANALAKVMTDCDLKPAEVFGAETISKPAVVKASPVDAVQMRDLTDDEIETEVLATYDRLARRRADLVSLVKLRGNLPDIPRQSLDRVLKAMDRRRAIQLEPDPNRKALPPEAHEAAVRIGGEDKHFISVSNR